jgi:hypothetical protein
MKFKDAQKLAVEHLSSQEFLNRVQEEDSTMLKQLDILKKINSLGYITNDSQAGRRSTGLHYAEKWEMLIEERAYMYGYMMEDKATKFIEQMAYQTDKNAVMIPVCGDDIAVPSSMDLPLTTTTRVSTGKRWTHTHVSMVLPENVDTFYRKQLHINKREKAVIVFCWDTKWNRMADGPNGLFTDIVKVLNTL